MPKKFKLPYFELKQLRNKDIKLVHIKNRLSKLLPASPEKATKQDNVSGGISKLKK